MWKFEYEHALNLWRFFGKYYIQKFKNLYSFICFLNFEKNLKTSEVIYKKAHIAAIVKLNWNAPLKSKLKKIIFFIFVLWRPTICNSLTYVNKPLLYWDIE